MVHARQFVILHQPITLPGYRSFTLEDGMVFSYHEDLCVYHCSEKRILLIGLAWQALPDLGSPMQEIEKLTPGPDGRISDAQIMAMEQSWCGRYVIICDDRIYLDTSGLFGVFYSTAGVSSDATLLAQAMGLPEKIYRAGHIATWFPGPYTHYEGVFRQMPSQIYAYRSGEIIPRRLLAQGHTPIRDKQALLKAFTDIFCQSLRNMQRLMPDRKLLLALTGGYDSRALLALCLKAGIDFSAFTLQHDNIFSGDVTVPGQLAEKLGLDYIYIPRDHTLYSKECEDEYHRHVAGLVMDEDRTFYAHGQYQQLLAKYGRSAILRSSVWSRVTEYLGREFTPSGPHPDIYDHFELPKDSVERASLAAYFDWCRAHPQQGLVDSDVFFWEQREGCWLPAIEQGFDLLDDAVTLQPMNCRLLVTMLLDFPREDRLVKAHETDITVYACPELAGIPYGGEKLHGETPIAYLRTKLKKAFIRLRKMGLRKTIGTYVMIFSDMKAKHDRRKQHEAKK